MPGSHPIPEELETAEREAAQPDALEEFLVCLNEPQREILAGIGASDEAIGHMVLESLPEGTSELFRTHGVITEKKRLTEFGQQVVEQLTFEAGYGPRPSNLAEAESLQERLVGASPPPSASEDRPQKRSRRKSRTSVETALQTLASQGRVRLRVEHDAWLHFAESLPASKQGASDALAALRRSPELVSVLDHVRAIDIVVSPNDFLGLVPDVTAKELANGVQTAFLTSLLRFPISIEFEAVYPNSPPAAQQITGEDAGAAAQEPEADHSTAASDDRVPVLLVSIS